MKGSITPKSSILSIFSFSVCLLPYGKRLSGCLIGTALPVLILCCIKSVWPKSPLDFEKKKKHFGVLLTILTMWFEFFIHFSCSFKFLITILSFYCVFVHPCSICSSYIRFVFCFWRLLFWGFTRIFVLIQHLNYYFVDLLEFCHRCLR